VKDHEAKKISKGESDVYVCYFAEEDVADNLVTRIQSNPAEGLLRGYLIVSGHMSNKKKHWLIVDSEESDSESIAISKKLLTSYREDKNRTSPFKRYDLLKAAGDTGKYPHGAPCVFVRLPNDEIRFGYTGMFRLAYDHSIGDLLEVPKGGLDFAQNLFGLVDEESKTQVAGRVFSGDGTLEGTFKKQAEEVRTILGSPKPTTFQHYLVQPSEGKTIISDSGEIKKIIDLPFEIVSVLLLAAMFAAIVIARKESKI
jgi:hypothetical protein